MRNRFGQQLESLNLGLIKMGALCEEAIALAMKALLENDIEVAEQAIQTEIQIDRMEREIENLCLKLILHQQPVATDLRVVSSALKMICDMERIGDQAADISEITKTIDGYDRDTLADIKEMSEATVKMVTESIDAFVNKDLQLAKKVLKDDDIVDELFDKVKKDLINLISNGSDGEYYIDLLMIAKYLERIGDHATNISNWIIFSITGDHQ